MLGPLEQEKVAALKRALGGLPEEFPDFKDDLYLLMWLKGSKLDVEKTEQRIQKSVEWRKQAGIYKLDEGDFEAEIDSAIITKKDGVAKDGTPVISMCFGSTKMYSLYCDVEPKRWDRYWKKISRSNEQAMIAGNRSRNAAKTSVSLDDVQGIYMVVDYEKCALMQYSSPGMISYFMGFCKELVVYYPDIIRRIYFLNLPMFILPTMKLISKILSGPNLTAVCQSGKDIEKNILPSIDQDQFLLHKNIKLVD